MISFSVFFSPTTVTLSLSHSGSQADLLSSHCWIMYEEAVIEHINRHFLNTNKEIFLPVPFYMN